MQGDERVSDEDVIRDLLACAQAWEPDARLIGNVRAGDVVRVLTTLAAKAGEIAALRAEVDEYAEITRGFGATIEELGPANEQLRAELSRLRARDEQTARVIEAARKVVPMSTSRPEIVALMAALDALDDATVAAEIEAAHDLGASCGASVEERAAHRWSGWPGAWCLDCGIEDPREACLTSGECPCGEPGHHGPCKVRVPPCTEPGSRRHDPYAERSVEERAAESAEPVCTACNDTHSVPVPEERAARGDTGPFGDGTWMCTSCPTPCRECACAGGRGAYCATTPCPCECHRKRAERNHARTQQRIGACLSMPPELEAAELRAISEAERADEEGER